MLPRPLPITPSVNVQIQTVRDAFAGIPENWGYTKHSAETSDKFSRVSSSIWVSKEEGSDYQGTIRLRWDSPSCSIVNVKKAQILHPDEDRVITLAEALALQGFPPWYILEGTDTEKAIQTIHVGRPLTGAPCKRSLQPLIRTLSHRAPTLMRPPRLLQGQTRILRDMRHPNPSRGIIAPLTLPGSNRVSLVIPPVESCWGTQHKSR
jgi:hypothetical protein